MFLCARSHLGSCSTSRVTSLPFVRVCRSRSSSRSPTCAFFEEPQRAGLAAFRCSPEWRRRPKAPSRIACGTTTRRSGACNGSAPPARSREPSPSPWTTQRWKSTSTETTTPGITNACSPPPRRAPHLSSGPHLSSTAPRQCAPRNCATARRVHRAEHMAPRNFRRAIRAARAAPTHRAKSFTPNQ